MVTNDISDNGSGDFWVPPMNTWRAQARSALMTRGDSLFWAAKTLTADEAIRCYRRALDVSPDYADAHFNLAGALARAGRGDEAVRHWQRYLELDAGSPWAKIARAHLEVVARPGETSE